jgi:5-methylcytosine-specific restriction endonuclease McrA
MKRSGFKKKKTKPMKRTKLKKVSSLGTLRNKCDKLLSPLIVKIYGKCELCGKPAQVAHHFVHKSKSNKLRYEIINLIPLCNSCHFALHQNESEYAARIVKIRGLLWFDTLEILKRETIKVNRKHYEEVYKELTSHIK